jgi:uncharacterized protein (DUF2225 family)
MADDITFYSKNDTVCPACNSKFKREELMTGRGRLSAGELTNELRRTYIPTQKYGTINPLIYPVTVCPSCLYAADDYDFLSIQQKGIQNIAKFKEVRALYLIKIFDKVPDFNEKRNLISGTASYILALSCYPFFDKKRFSPTIKTGLCSLRAAWLMIDLFNETKDPKYQELSQIFYKKASEFYDLALSNQSKAVESLDGAKNLGPDTDKNYGYDGLLYINAVLKYKNAHIIEDPIEKLKLFQEVKRTISKVFGMGKKAKNKPEVLLSFSKEIYDKLGEEIETLETSLGQIHQEDPEDESDDK